MWRGCRLKVSLNRALQQHAPGPPFSCANTCPVNPTAPPGACHRFLPAARDPTQHQLPDMLHQPAACGEAAVGLCKAHQHRRAIICTQAWAPAPWRPSPARAGPEMPCHPPHALACAEHTAEATPAGLGAEPAHPQAVAEQQPAGWAGAGARRQRGAQAGVAGPPHPRVPVLQCAVRPAQAAARARQKPGGAGLCLQPPAAGGREACVRCAREVRGGSGAWARREAAAACMAEAAGGKTSLGTSARPLSHSRISAHLSASPAAPPADQRQGGGCGGGAALVGGAPLRHAAAVAQPSLG